MIDFTAASDRKLLKQIIPRVVLLTLVCCSLITWIAIATDPTYVIDLADPVQMTKVLKRTTGFRPEPFGNPSEENYYHTLCQEQLADRIKMDKERYQSASAILLGKHTKTPNVYACVITVVSDTEAHDLCKSDSKSYVRNDSKDKHRVVCRFNRKD